MEETDTYWSGTVYAKLIDPFTQRIRDEISIRVPEESSIIDLGCGTGALVLQLHEKAGKVVGVDPSPKMIDQAKKQQARCKANQVEFVEGDASNLGQFKNGEFDVATISMVIHGLPRELAISILKEAKRIAKRIIIADYMAQLPLTISGLGVRVIELLAGLTHFKNFRDYEKGNGIESLLTEAGLVNENESPVSVGAVTITNAN